MSKIIGMITGNPLVLLWIVLGAFAAGAASGGSVAWWIQGLNVTAAEQEFTTYRQTQTALIQAEKDRATIQREKAGQDYEHLSNILNDEINRHVVLQRCVAAGKCGVRNKPPVPACTGIRSTATIGLNGPSSNAVPSISGTAEEDPVVNDCAISTLRANRLQDFIANQPGYAQ